MNLSPSGRQKARYRLEVLGNEVTKRRLAKAWTRPQLAKASGISESRIHKIEAGLAGGVSPETVQSLASVLECDVQDISSVEERSA